MNPDSYILMEALNQGIQRMRAHGYIQFSTACQKVKTKTGEHVVPVLVAAGPDDVPFLMFFAGQVETRGRGVADYFVTIKPKEEVVDLTKPKAYSGEDDEDKFLRWTPVQH